MIDRPTLFNTLYKKDKTTDASGINLILDDSVFRKVRKNLATLVICPIKWPPLQFWARNAKDGMHGSGDVSDSNSFTLDV